MGFTSGLSLLVAHIAFGSFMYSGALAPYCSRGVGLAQFGSFAACLIVVCTGGFRGAISGLSPALAPAMASVGATMDADNDALFVNTA